MNLQISSAYIPMRLVGPVKIVSAELDGEVNVPLATFEVPLWSSVRRGALISRLTSGISASVLKNCMTRSVLLEADDVKSVFSVQNALDSNFSELEKIALQTSSFVKLQDVSSKIVGNLIYLRFSFDVGDASGHNMSTKASSALLDWIIKKHPYLRYVSLSGNFCTDKKASSVNSILGRGKYVVAEILVPGEICCNKLHTTPQRIVDLNVKKNLIGSIISGSVCTANAHFANMLLAFYLSTGQDAANIVEGSQGVSHAEVRGDDLYFSVTLPNIIVGTVGNGKDLPFVQENLKMLGCLEKRDIGINARRLAIIAASTVLCGELSLLAALTNKDELMRSHLLLERGVKL